MKTVMPQVILVLQLSFFIFNQLLSMKNILETTLLEFDKSSYLIDLVRHDTGKLYIEIVQTINGEGSSVRSIKINPGALTDIVRVLQIYQDRVPTKKMHDEGPPVVSDQQKIQERYLKGVSIKELALQFDYSEELIEMVLRNRGVKIVSNKPPKFRRWRRRKR